MTYEEELAQLEQEERELTDEAILALLALLVALHLELENAIREFYQKYGKNGVVTYADARKWTSNSDHRKRWTVLLLLLASKFNSFKVDALPKVSTLLKQIIAKETEFFDVDLDVDDILNSPWGIDDALWSTRLADDIDMWNAYVATDLKRSLLRRDRLDDVLEQLDKRFMSIERVLERLGVTESTAMSSIARKEIFKELGITKYQFFAREDERTCEICGSLHGLIFPISAYSVGETASPVHPRCRCWEVPIRD